MTKKVREEKEKKKGRKKRILSSSLFSIGKGGTPVKEWQTKKGGKGREKKKGRRQRRHGRVPFQVNNLLPLLSEGKKRKDGDKKRGKGKREGGKGREENEEITGYYSSLPLPYLSEKKKKKKKKPPSTTKK